MSEFKPFPKIPRLLRRAVISEKIDGTNASILLAPEPQHGDGYLLNCLGVWHGLAVYAGSRNRWLTRESDNFGFAKWVSDHVDALVALGPGHHFGEWYGKGIQRGYGLDEKRFMLFNTDRWCRHDREPMQVPTNNPTITKMQSRAPACCDVATVLWDDQFSQAAALNILDELRFGGSKHIEGYDKPEGIVVYHTAANQMFKITIDGDDQHKGS